MRTVGALFLGVGLALLWLGGLGIVRARSPYVRLHMAGVADTGGAGVFLIGLMFYTGWAATGGLTVVLLLFLLFTGPLATHAIAKSAFTRKMRD